MTYRSLIAATLTIIGLTGFILYGATENLFEEENPGIVIESVTKKPSKKSARTGAFSLVGESILNFPDTGLINQDGQPFAFGTLSGDPVVLSFIYTRCPDKRMCPLVTQKMARIKDRASRAGIDLRLVSITMDPEYDTPARLKRHANERNLTLDDWNFVTGSPATIRTLEDRFKISVLREKNQIRTHNMRTYLTDASGTIKDVQTGSGWPPKTFVRQIKQLSEETSGTEQ